MKRFTLLVAALSGLVFFTSTSQAAVILVDKFDQYADQAAFEAAWPAIGTVAPLSGDLTTANPNQVFVPDKSVEVDGTLTNSQQRNQRTFAETGNVSTTQNTFWSFSFYDSNSAASPYRQASNLQDTTAPSGTNQLIAMGLNNNQTVANSGGNYYMARILGYNPTAAADPDGGPVESVGGAGAFFKLNDFGTSPLRTTGWHDFKVVMSSNDGLSTDYDFYVDGVLAERVHNVGTAAQIRSYDNIRIGTGLSNASNGAQYDNMRVQTGGPTLIPEPTSLVLFAIALCCSLGLVRRRNG
jgi:hypothetical protein